MNINLEKMLTFKERQRIKAITDREPSEKVAQCIANEVITPVLDRIEKFLGQRMDAKWLAYACMYARPWPDSKQI